MPYIIFLFLLTFMVPAYADRTSDAYEACSGYAAIPVNVVPRFDPPVYDYSQNINGIMGLASDVHHTIHESLTLGLTRYEPILSISAPIIGVHMPNGATCARVERVDVALGYQHVVVYIAKDIPQGTCGFNEVMGHEQKHINVNMRVLQKYAPLIEDEMKAYLKVSGTLQEENLDYAMSMIKDKLNDIIHRMMAEMTAENEQLQRNVDTPDEYARVSASCNGQLRTIAGQFLQQR